MSMQDRLSDMLTVIRNGQSSNKKEIHVPFSKMCLNVAKLLAECGYLEQVNEVEIEGHKKIGITLKYVKSVPVIKNIKRVSKPGLRVYTTLAKMPKVLSGLGVAIVSTSKGIMTDQQARKLGFGGELLLFVY